jgi:hypothetical protein
LQSLSEQPDFGTPVPSVEGNLLVGSSLGQLVPSLEVKVNEDLQVPWQFIRKVSSSHFVLSVVS